MFSNIAYFVLCLKVPYKYILAMYLVLSTNVCIYRCSVTAKTTVNVWGERLNGLDERILNMQAIDYGMEIVNVESQAGHKFRSSTRSARDLIHVQEIDYNIEDIDTELLPIIKDNHKQERETSQAPTDSPQNDINYTVIDDNDPVKIVFDDADVLNQHINDLIDNNLIDNDSIKDEARESPIMPILESFTYGLQRIGKGIWSFLKLL